MCWDGLVTVVLVGSQLSCCCCCYSVDVCGIVVIIVFLVAVEDFVLRGPHLVSCVMQLTS